jgi:hypothetical protein
VFLGATDVANDLLGPAQLWNAVAGRTRAGDRLGARDITSAGLTGTQQAVGAVATIAGAVEAMGGKGVPCPPETTPGGAVSTKGYGNVGGGATTAENALMQAERWLGPGYKEIAPGVFRSAKGTRQFRITTSDLADPRQGPHVHFETIGADGRTITESSHVGITDP